MKQTSQRPVAIATSWGLRISSGPVHMKNLKNRVSGALVLAAVLLASSLVRPAGLFAAEEQKFDVLQIGTRTYRNVTVTTKSKDYVFLLHSEGMANIKVKELSPEVRQELGYVDPPPPKTVGTTANEWAKKSLGKIETPQVKAFAEELNQAWASKSLRGFQLPALTARSVQMLAVALFASYLFFCYCCQLIRQKIGKKPSSLIWVPILQALPMLDAAGMPSWWFLAGFVPGLNLLAGAVWCFKIAQARGKGLGVGFLLLVPVLNLLAFLYLAFANGSAPVKERRRVEIMTLETA